MLKGALSLDQLLAIRAFARVVEAGTFTKAADSLQIPLATVSKLVRTLEKHLGVKLLLRTTRRVTVTTDGAAYYEKTAALLQSLEDIDSSFQSAQSKPRGHLRVDIGGTFARLVVIPALPDFLAKYPDISIDFGVSDRQVDLISDNVDCVIRSGELNDLSLVARLIGNAPWVTCATPGYLEKHGVPRKPGDLETGHSIVNYISTRTGRPMPMNFARGKEIIELAVPHVVGVNESNAHFAAALAGLGIIQTFSYMAQSHIEKGDIVPILEDWNPAPYPFYVVYPPNRYLSNRLRVFIDWIAGHFVT
ncbi:LysR substrate-binding domain-containing protein [Caballeronia sordidicola]|uniref:LysR substrate-binding domain-containing protein n=1 Tax=Caballeronia sordidicola TaxID=196367 RepID=UPI002E155431